MIKLYTMPRCSGCEEIKRRLNTWRITYKELPLIHLQNIFPSTIWSAPVLAIDEKLYEYNDMNTRSKLWNLVGKYQDMLPQSKKKLKIRRIRCNQNAEKTVVLELTSLARINITILQALMGIDINDLVNTWPLKERETFMIAWRLSQHHKANDLLMLSDMITIRAKNADPFMKDNKHTWIGDIDNND